MRRKNRSIICMEQLESRTLLSASWGFFGGHGSNAQVTAAKADPTIQADVAAIKTDRTQLSTDLTTLRPTLRTDQQAIGAAISALSATLQPLKTQLRTDARAGAATLWADFKAIRTDRHDATLLAADKAKLTADMATLKTTLTADQAAIQAVIDADPTVTAAKAKLTTDSQPITTDQAALSAAYTQLNTDLTTLFPTVHAVSVLGGFGGCGL